MTGTKIVATDLDTGESDEQTITDDYCLICDGLVYVDRIVTHANGTTILTVKKSKP